jgi:hypothetical protein
MPSVALSPAPRSTRHTDTARLDVGTRGHQPAAARSRSSRARSEALHRGSEARRRFA